VQYEAPVFVRIEPDENGWEAEVTKVVVVVEHEQMTLARDDRGPLPGLRLAAARGGLSDGGGRGRRLQRRPVPATRLVTAGPG